MTVMRPISLSKNWPLPKNWPVPALTIFDLEFTAWECSMPSHWLRPGEFKEVVQIGAVRLDGANFRILDEFEVLVRPRINGNLSLYFEKLTGISDAMLAQRGVDFADAYDRFADFAGEGPVCAFGHDDWVLEENIRLYGIKDVKPLGVFHDLRTWFAEQGIDPRGLHSCDIGPKLGAPFVGRSHNALDDARSVASAMAIMVGHLAPAA
ncbi:MAG TPA: 3'-5' exonuclease [Rhizomicrobium sp.]|nr:3'-5' exonuclease [Rhizomicrobium sp.]